MKSSRHFPAVNFLHILLSACVIVTLSIKVVQGIGLVEAVNATYSRVSNAASIRRGYSSSKLLQIVAECWQFTAKFSAHIVLVAPTTPARLHVQSMILYARGLCQSQSLSWTIEYLPTSPRTLSMKLFSHISAGESHVCAIRRTRGNVQCWKRTEVRKNGVRKNQMTNTLIIIPASPDNFLTSRTNFTCGMEDDHRALCWDISRTNLKSNQISNGYGYLLWNFADRLMHTQFEFLQAGGRLSCGLTFGTRTLACWEGKKFGNSNFISAHYILAPVLAEQQCRVVLESTGEALCMGTNFWQRIDKAASAKITKLSPHTKSSGGRKKQDSATIFWQNCFPLPTLRARSLNTIRARQRRVSRMLVAESPLRQFPVVSGEPSLASGSSSSKPHHYTLILVVDAVIGVVGILTGLVTLIWCYSSNWCQRRELTGCSWVITCACNTRGQRDITGREEEEDEEQEIDTPIPPASSPVTGDALFGRREFAGERAFLNEELRAGFRQYLSRAESAESSRRRSQTGSGPMYGGAEAFSFGSLAAATAGFADENKIGSGSFGSVYRGMLFDGREVAIKRADRSSAKKIEENESAFEAELEFLSRLHHKHLVNLIGFCDDRDERLLVYEFMPNGTLHDHLHKQRSDALSSWQARIRVALQAARGIEYLHTYAVPPIIHRDIKSANILLDSKWCARVSDFGLSLISPSEELSHLTTGAAGTLGYMDPEYYTLQRLTTKSDVYSFGVVLMELLTGKKAIHRRTSPHTGTTNVVDYAMPLIRADDLLNILDPRVHEPAENESEAVEIIAEIAQQCVRLAGQERPTMTEIVSRLEHAVALSRSSISKREFQQTAGRRNLELLAAPLQLQSLAPRIGTQVEVEASDTRTIQEAHEEQTALFPDQDFSQSEQNH